jgi:hypothetical protein
MIMVSGLPAARLLPRLGTGEFSILIIMFVRLNCEISATWAFVFRC